MEESLHEAEDAAMNYRKGSRKRRRAQGANSINHTRRMDACVMELQFCWAHLQLLLAGKDNKATCET